MPQTSTESKAEDKADLSRPKAKARKYFAAVANRWDKMREDFFDETVADTILKPRT